MFRATLERSGDTATLRVEGRLSGPSVAELDECWHQLAAANGNRQIVVELKEVTFVSSEGKRLLQKLCRSGAQLQGDGLMTRALVEEILGCVGQVERR